jgi:hypothetical protein
MCHLDSCGCQGQSEGSICRRALRYVQHKARALGQVCINKHAANLIHDGQVESLSQSILLRAVSLGNLMTDSLLA